MKDDVIVRVAVAAVIDTIDCDNMGRSYRVRVGGRSCSLLLPSILEPFFCPSHFSLTFLLYYSLV